MPKPTPLIVAVDVAFASVRDGALVALLRRRDDATATGGDWALPGGVVRAGEGLEATVARVLAEKAGGAQGYVEQLKTFGDPGRDPRGHVVSVAHMALAPLPVLEVVAEADEALALATVAVDWEGEAGGEASATLEGVLLSLAFDHAVILSELVKRLRGRLDYTPLGLEMLPPRLTLRDAQAVWEAVQARTFAKPAFRRRLLDRGWLRATGEREAGGAHRPAELFERV